MIRLIEVFANRVVCASPGFPPGGQSIERISRGEARSRARNPLLVQGLTWLGYLRKQGTGRGTQYIPTATLRAEISSDLRPTIGRESDANPTHHGGGHNLTAENTEKPT